MQHKNLKAVLLFAVMTVLLTWPLVTHLTDYYPSTFYSLGGDPNMYISYIDLIAKKVSGTLPTSLDKMIFYPAGTNFSSGYEGAVMLAMGVPIVLVTHNPILAYNLIVLLAMILTCYACYRLIYYLTNSYSSSLITGLSFGLSPFMLVRGMQHIDLLFLFTVPLIALTTLKFIEVPTRKNAAWLALSVLLTALCAWYYLLAGLIFIGLAFLFTISKFLANKKIYAWAAIFIAVSVLLPATPILLNRNHKSLEFAEALVNNAGAQPLNFFVPHPFATMWHITEGIYKNFPTVHDDPYPYFESTSYFGLVGLIALFTLFFLRKQIPIPNKSLWITTMVVFIILALGTSLRVASLKIPMPFALLHKVFPFDHLRAPNRFFVFSYLATTVIFGYFLASSGNFFKRRNAKILFSASLLVLLLCERLFFPYPLVKMRVSEFYKSIANEEGYAIADLPIIFPGYNAYNFYQTFHNKPIVSGEFFWTSYDSHTFNFVKNNSLLLNTYDCTPDLADMHRAEALKNLAENNIKFIVVHNFFLHEETKCPDKLEYIRKFFQGQKSFFSDGEITVYSTTP